MKRKLLLSISIMLLGSLAYSQSANYIPKYSNSTTTNNSVIYQNTNTIPSIGIGTISPGARLQINEKNSDGILKIFRERPDNPYDSLNASLYFETSLSKEGAKIGFCEKSIINTEGNTFAKNPSYIHFNVPAKVERMVINNNGDIGIGTNTPNAKLDVRGDETLLKLKGYTKFPNRNSANARMIFQTEIFNNIGTSISYYESNVLSIDPNSYSENGLYFSTFADNTFKNTMFISMAGNVCIGTNKYPAKFNVNSVTEKIASFYKSISEVDKPITSIEISAISNGSLISNSVNGKDITLYTNTNTGIANSNQLYLASNGNIGISTNITPSKLSVNSATNSSIASFIGYSDNIEVEIYGSSTMASIRNKKQNKGFELATTNSSNALNSNQIYLNPNGNVGIGTNNPLSKFQIGGIWTFYDGPNDKIIGHNTVYRNNRNERINNGIASRMYFSGTGDIVFQTVASGSASSQINDSDWKNFIMKNNGNVYLGSSSSINASISKFTIEGSGNTFATESGAHPLLILSGTTTSDYVLYMGADKTNKNSYIQSIQYGTGWSTLALNARGGSVAIGTIDAKGYKLAVAGKMIAEEIFCKLQINWPDFVFDKNYNLKPLNEVEEFIIANNHLPNVPSANEINEAGINLGDMNAILLQKIEELTLYTIQQQKLIEELAKTSQEQQKTIDELKNNVK